MIFVENKFDALYLSHYTGGHGLDDSPDNNRLAFAHRFDGIWYDRCGRELFGDALFVVEELARIAIDLNDFIRECGASEKPMIERQLEWCRPTVEQELAALDRHRDVVTREMWRRVLG